MIPSFDRQTSAVVLVTALLVTAGCSGLGGSSQTERPGAGTATVPPTASPDSPGTEQATTTAEPATAGGTTERPPTPTATPTPTPEETAQTPTSTTRTPGGPSVDAYSFSEGEFYTYTARSDEGKSTFTWRVTDVEDDQVTVNVTATNTDGLFRSEEFTATRGSVIAEAGNTSLAVLFFSLHVGRAAAVDRSLTPGNEWEIQASDVPGGADVVNFETATVEVTGTDSYGGIECANLAITPEGSSTITQCVDPDYPFAIHINSDGGAIQEFTLTNSSR